MGSNHNDDSDDDSKLQPPADVAPLHGRELTGRELLAAAQRDGGNLPTLLDPQTAAELARWFEQPALAHGGQGVLKVLVAEPRHGGGHLLLHKTTLDLGQKLLDNLAA